MLVKKIKDRLPLEFTKSIDLMTEQMGFPLDFSANLDDIRIGFSAARDQSIEAGMAIKHVIKESHTAPWPDGSHDIPLFIYRPENQTKPLPVVYWIHGGGLVVGVAEQDEAMLKAWVNEFNCVAVSVEYRLAPDYPFPVPLEDCSVVLEHIFNNADALQIDPERIVLGGGSAGGGLAAALAQKTCDEGKIKISHQLLCYPMLDCKNQSKAAADVDDTYIWSRDNNYFGWKSYLGDDPVTIDPPKYASAPHHHDLRNLPPASILVGDIDLFAQEDIAYAARLSAAGIPTALHVYPGGVHGFEGVNQKAGITKEFIRTRDLLLKTALGGK
ncbi:alpha/beta hydrolase [Agarilytica rhodophyticola]|uniref:alpha/beta hydrolase n=1 Tax=Agarilytica rhodophyticola TaxID=1737490 RepID=UPI000B34368C|nr:alpha/beta hydrolase [Agarilytica rhodophyticola]